MESPHEAAGRLGSTSLASLSGQAGGVDALVSHRRELRVQLDAAPLSSLGFGHQADSAGPKERIKHNSRFPPGAAATG